MYEPDIQHVYNRLGDILAHLVKQAPRYRPCAQCGAWHEGSANGQIPGLCRLRPLSTDMVSKHDGCCSGFDREDS